MKNQAEIDKLMQFGTVEHVPAKTVLSSAYFGDEDISLFILLEGVCALGSITRRGDELTYFFFEEGELMGYMNLLNEFYLPAKKRKPHRDMEMYLVFAQTDATVLRLRYSQCAKLIHNTDFQTLLIASISRHYLNTLTHCSYDVNTTAVAKLCTLLLNQSEPAESGRLQVDRFLSYKQIARRLGIHEVTVARIMRQLIAEGVLQREGQRVFIANRKRLAAFADGEETVKY